MVNYYEILSNEAHRPDRACSGVSLECGMSYGKANVKTIDTVELHKIRFELLSMKQYLLLMDSNVLMMMMMVRDNFQAAYWKIHRRNVL